MEETYSQVFWTHCAVGISFENCHFIKPCHAAQVACQSPAENVSTNRSVGLYDVGVRELLYSYVAVTQVAG